MLELWDGTKKNDKQLIIHKDLHKITTSWLMHSLSTFGVRTSHGQTQTHKIHHNPDLGEATTFPLIVYCVAFHEAHIQMAFVLGLPNGSLEIPRVGSFITLGLHNFVCRPMIAMRSETKL